MALALCPTGDPPWVTGTRGGGAQPAASVRAMAEPLAAPLLPVPLPARVCGGGTARVATGTSGTPAHLLLGGALQHVGDSGDAQGCESLKSQGAAPASSLLSRAITLPLALLLFLVFCFSNFFTTGSAEPPGG